MARGDRVAGQWRARGGPCRRCDVVCDFQPAGAGRNLHRPRCARVRRDADRGELANGGHGRQRLQREEADQHARLVGRRSDSPHPAAAVGPRAGHRVHQRRRARRGDADHDPPPQARALGEHASEERKHRQGLGTGG